jgi:hypothetical protein
VKVDKELETAVFRELSQASLGGVDFRIDRLLVPVAVVIARIRLFSSVSRRDVVDVHDRDDKQVDTRTEPGGLGISADEPLDQSPCDPTRPGFPGMLTRLNPYDRRLRTARRLEMKPLHGAAGAGLAENEVEGVRLPLPGLGQEAFGLFGSERRPQATQRGPPVPTILYLMAEPARSPGSVCRQEEPSFETAARCGIAHPESRGFPVSRPLLRAGAGLPESSRIAVWPSLSPSMRKDHQQGHPRFGSPPGVNEMVRRFESTERTRTEPPSKSDDTFSSSVRRSSARRTCSDAGQIASRHRPRRIVRSIENPPCRRTCWPTSRQGTSQGSALDRGGVGRWVAPRRLRRPWTVFGSQALLLA